MNSNISHPEVSRIYNKKIIVIASVIAEAGVVALILTWFAIASVLLIAAVILFVAESKINIYKPSGSVVKTEILYMDKEELPVLKTILEGKVELGGKEMHNSEDAPRKVKFVEAGSARVDYITSSDRQFVAFHLFEFVPHKYEEYLPTKSFSGADASRLISYIERCRKG